MAAANESGAGPGGASSLRGKQRRHLRGLGVNLDPAVMVGKDGISPDVLAALDRALTKHELVKVRLQDSAGEDRKAVARELAESAGVELVQVLGRTVLLWRRNEEEPRIMLPD
jgi:RNA-binding protein